MTERRQRTKAAALAALFLLLNAGMVSADSSRISAEEIGSDLDDVFDGAAEDITEIDPAGDFDHTKTFTESEKLIWSGSFVAEGGIGSGWVDWPIAEDLGKGLDHSVGAKSTFKLNLDAKPDKYFRIFSSVESTLDPAETGEFSWSPLTVDTLYADYFGIPNTFVRFGQFQTVWGQGRLFKPGNLMDGSEDGTTLRIGFPTILSGFSVFALAKHGYDSETLPYEKLAYGAIGDHIFGTLRATAGVRYLEAEGIAVLGSLKHVVFGTDVFADGVYRYDQNGTHRWKALGGFLKEWSRILLYGEYQYDGSVDNGHSIGLTSAYRRTLKGTTDLGIKWLHTWSDDSGTLTFGATWRPWPRMTVSAAVPITYGDDGSTYVIDNEDPANRRIALVLLAKISGTF